MFILIVTAQDNKLTLINIAIAILCSLLFILLHYLVKKCRKYSLQPIKDSLLENQSDDKELPSLSLSSIRKDIPTDLERIGISYNERYDYFFNLPNCNRKTFGACRLYDEALAPIGILVNLENIYFDYDGKHWLIQLKKGQYGLACGGEIGVYQTKLDALYINGFFNGMYYQCNPEKDALLISYSIIKKNDVFLTRKASSWCVNSYRLGTFTEPEDLIMHIRITFPSLSMCTAFYEALLSLNYPPEEITIRHNTIYFIFDKPMGPQPLTKNILITYIMQKNNYSYILAYEYITQDYTDTLDKLAYLKNYFPDMYNELIKIGQPDEIFQDYEQIANHLKNK